jgi:DNA-binding transcriptional LysR family regulator
MVNSTNEMGVFARVVDRGSFAAAAEDLGLSPSAVSKLVTRLESRLGVRLLARTTRRLALTAEGEVFLERSRNILDAIEAAEAEVSTTRRAAQGHLRVHAFPSFAVDHLSTALPEFLARYPRVTFDFLITNRAVDLVEDNIDVALRVGPLGDPGFASRKIADLTQGRVRQPRLFGETRHASSPAGPCPSRVLDTQSYPELAVLVIQHRRRSRGGRGPRPSGGR